MKPVTDSSFALVASMVGPTVVKFEADWCAPCRAMKPALAAIEQEFGDRVRFFSANIDEASMTASELNIGSVPTLVAFENGKVVATKSGAATKAAITNWIDSMFPATPAT